ncbi:MAG: hypothetical protein M2R46_04010 [Verrucomicrobia subdivision 3 bacterium]|nr:hypothetical protein [Limisphaerales bacterium]
MDRNKIRHYFISNQSALNTRMKVAKWLFVGTYITILLYLLCVPATTGMERVEALAGFFITVLLISLSVILLPLAVWGSSWWEQRIPGLLGAGFLLFVLLMVVLNLLDRAAG